MSEPSKESIKSTGEPPRSEVERAVREGTVIGLPFNSFDVFGVHMSLGEVISLISPLDRTSCLDLLAALNWHSTLVTFTSESGWSSAPVQLDALILRFLPPEVRLRARLLANSEDFAGPIMEIALLTLAGLVCRFSAETAGINADTRLGEHSLFKSLLGIQSGIAGKKPDEWKDSEFFPRMTQLTWRNLSVQNMLARDLARLHAYLTIPEISAGLREPISAWFHKHLQITGEDYEAIANSLMGAASMGGNFSALFRDFPEVERRMAHLKQLCSTNTEAVKVSAEASLALDASDPDAINEAQKLADEFFRTPLLVNGERTTCLSARLIFNRLHRGLHYLVVEPYAGNANKIKEVRAECGSLLERYVVWLLRQFLPKGKARIVHSYRIKSLHGSGTEPPERDIVVFVGEKAVIFEVKAAIPNIGHRRRAKVEDFVYLFLEATKQAATAADALVAGDAYEDIALTKQLPRVTHVVPCVVCFEPFPLRFPVALEFEAAIATALSLRPFEITTARMPVQFFGIDDLEAFGDTFGLPNEWKALLNAIARRASRPDWRYKPIVRTGSIPDGIHEGSEALPKLVHAAYVASSKRWHELTRG